SESSSGEETYFGTSSLATTGRAPRWITQRDRFPLYGSRNSNLFRGNWVSGDGRKMKIAMKLLRIVREPEQFDRLLDELMCAAHAWRELSHCNVLPFFGAYNIGASTPALISPFCEHGHIRNYIRNYPFSNRDRLVHDVVSGLRYLHHNKIVHGNLKPQNILVNGCEVACLADHSLAQIISREGVPCQSDASSVYAAPELLSLIQPLTPNPVYPKPTTQSDIYSLALVSLEILTSEPPKGKDNKSFQEAKILHGFKPQRTQYDVSEVTPEMCTTVQSIIQRDRYPLPAQGNSNIYRGTLIFSNGTKVKVMLKNLRRSDDESQVEGLEKRLRREAYVWSTLPGHRNILPFYGLFDIGEDLPTLISPFCSFGNVRLYLDSEYRNRANRPYLALGVARGLDFLHRNGVIHGDLKPANVLVDMRGEACICDFGISRIVGQQGFTTRSQGTIPYKAPELLADPTRSTTFQSDIYSFALVVLEILTGERLKGRPVPHEVPFGGLPQDALNTYHPQRLDYGMGGDKLFDSLWEELDRCWNIVPESRPSMAAIYFNFILLLEPVPGLRTY
ncbi:RGS domain-containing serine/threonine-protein kinase A, partial [Favolaschia claudopus]